jgi:cell wall-associated NlpC family hydrolase
MKRNLLLAIITGLLTGILLSANAQSEKAPRFIESIEIVPQVNHGYVVTTANKIEPSYTSPVQSTPTASVLQNDNEIEKCTNVQFKYALLMNRDVESLDNLILYNFIDEWIKTPYRYGGCSKDGIDCSSFASVLMQKVYGIDLPRSANDQYGSCKKISREDLQEGDLVFFHTRKGVSHVGVYLGNNYFVHSSTHSGVTIDNLDEAYYNQRYIGGGRMTKL